ncbi:glycosyltransferase [Anaeromyxobacter paludicola]|uniref:Glycosyltransferase EpsF n=1 Tax=Anaeromyxobacter paludicola TaxID=2918171 RepID=A0ABM7X9I9_9BACT|nr:glycosyltransferase [Anaeromyxobacter paludicola]BDG08515.1 putative glycosyltransferase EpsF [Anaeromyxobacter paludicola]
MTIRVLHVVGQMNRGGVETWLMQVLRNADRGAVRMDFLVSARERGHYDAEIEALGSAVIRVASPHRPLRYARDFLSVLRRRGPYQVVDSHVHHFSGVTLALARLAGVPVRIAHSHSDTRELESGGGLARRAYLAAMERSIRRFATDGLAVSGAAACALFGPRWKDDGRFRVARCGLDFAPYREPAARAAVREELEIPPGALVIGHVGRFDVCKNQQLLIGTLAAVLRREPSAHLVLVGTGPLQARVEEEATRLAVRDRVRFAGLRPDVPRLLSAFDVFVLPSVREGLPLVGLEAQAAGLPIVISDRVTRELVVVPELFTWRSPQDPSDAWADAILGAVPGRIGAAALARLEESDFALSRTLPRLLQTYGVAR